MGKSKGRARRAGREKRKAAIRSITRKNHRAAGAESVRRKLAEVPKAADDQEIYGPPRWRPPRPQVKIEGGKLVITLQRIDPPKLSRSGKTHLVACTYGPRQSKCMVEGHPVQVVCTAFIYDYGRPYVNFKDQFDSLLDLVGIKRRDDDEDDDDEPEGETEELV